MQRNMSCIAKRHLEQIDINQDGGVLVVSSNLTGQFWNGALNYFSSGIDVCSEIYKNYVAKEMVNGMSDGTWCDESHVLVGSDEGDVYVLKLEEGFFIDDLDIMTHHSYVTSLSVNSDATRCISGSADTCINIGDISECSLIRKYRGHSQIINQVVCHNSSPQQFASCSQDGSVLIWDTRNERPARRIDLTSDITTSVAYYGDHLVLGTERGQLLLSDVKSDKVPMKVISGHSRAVKRITFAPNKSNLVATCAEDGSVSVLCYDLLNTRTIYRDESHKDYVTGIAWVPGVTQLYSCSWDSTVKLHNVELDS